MDKLKNVSYGSRNIVRNAYYTADNEEPDYNHQDLAQSFGIISHLAVDCDVESKPLSRYIKVENGRDTNGPKESNKECLAPFFNLVDSFVNQHNEWGSSK